MSFDEATELARRYVQYVKPGGQVIVITPQEYGYRADPTHVDYVPLEVTNYLLGGSFHSRITMNIREAKGYTYSPFSMISSRPKDAFWAEVADVTTNVTGPISSLSPGRTTASAVIRSPLR